MSPPALEVSIPMARTLSWSSVASVNSVPLTPLGQTMETPPNFMRLTRLNSESSVSVATTDDDEDFQSHSNNPRHAFVDWPQKDDSLLLKVYEECLADPTLAPFAGPVPPSGILTLVAKGTLKRAKLNSTPFNHSISAIRKRLLLLCRRQEQAAACVTDQEMETTFEFDGGFPASEAQDTLASPRGRKLFDDNGINGSPFGGSPAQQLAQAQAQAQQHILSTPVHRRGSAVNNEDFSFASETSSPSDGRRQPSSNPHMRLTSALEKTAKTSTINSWLLTCNSPANGQNANASISSSSANSLGSGGGSPLYGVAITTEGSEVSPTPPPHAHASNTISNAMGTNMEFPLTPISPSVRRSQRHKTPGHLDPPQAPQYYTVDRPLASPFKELPKKPLKDISFDASAVTPTGSQTFEPFPNYTAQRKRNSLNTKRGVK